ncbi:MAG: STAS domain-containing protein [Actinomycetota bacterium]
MGSRAREVIEPAELRLDWFEGSAIARLSGDIDLSNAEALKRSIADSMSNQELRLVIDLSDVDYLDSAGIAMLFHLSRRLVEHQQQLILLMPADSSIRRSLQVSGWPADVPIVESLANPVSGSSEVP